MEVFWTSLTKIPKLSSTVLNQQILNSWQIWDRRRPRKPCVRPVAVQREFARGTRISTWVWRKPLSRSAIQQTLSESDQCSVRAITDRRHTPPPLIVTFDIFVQTKQRNGSSEAQWGRHLWEIVSDNWFVSLTMLERFSFIINLEFNLYFNYR